MNYHELVNLYLERYATQVGLTITPLDTQGYTSFNDAKTSIGINVLLEEMVLMVLCPIMPLPKDGHLELYDKLLKLNFLETSDAAFAIDAEKEVIYLRAFRGLVGLDYEECFDILQTMRAIADRWATRLKAEFG